MTRHAEVALAAAAAMEPGGARAVARCDLLSRWPFSDTRDHLFRPFLGPGHEATCEITTSWMQEAGMTVSLDPAGNILGRYEGLTPGAPALLVGSHVDSVKDAGSYDGMLGVMLGVELVDAFHRAGRRLPFALEVIGFGDEEGSRFPSYMLGSRSVAGVLPPDALAVSDRGGVSLVNALSGWGVDPDRFADAYRAPGEVAAYLEAHIEQAPSLEEAGLPLGVVSSIAAQARYYFTVEGMAAHAGTAMHKRRDALTASAAIVLAIEEIAARGPVDLVATVGWLSTGENSATNIVSGAVTFSLDLRAALRETRDRAASEIFAAAAAICAERRVGHAVEERHQLAGAVCDQMLNEALSGAVRDVAGYEPPLIVSQAGHDAMNIAAIAPVSMLFIRCAGGISHNPAESVLDDDVELALAAMIRFADELAQNPRFRSP
ncbi:allantoate amidohydrolase [Acetobacter sacchari]